MPSYDRDFRLSKDVLPRRYDLKFDLDLDTWTSQGEERIALVTAKPTHELVLHSVELDITSASIDGNALEGTTAHDEAQVVVLRFANEIPAGQHILGVRWRGGIRESLRGLYRSMRGEERYAATQFEAADARRAFPCFDEPEFKAVFSLELVHPSGNAALANMPVSSQEEIGENRTRTTFRETPVRISSYLLAFTVGPYESTPETTTPSKIAVRCWLPPGLATQAIYARDAHARSIEWLQQYTALPYPFIKIDAIGIPDFEAGAMENPGAITYRTRLLAADEKNASIVTLKGVFSTAAHELTHMWWGDLVTMRWWTDLWLNESFASFVGEKCTAALNPEWRYWRDFVADNTSAFNLDALASTHPISIEAKNAEEASERFDAITYTKGAAVLRMIESYLGEEAFRAGVRIYLNRHKESNASADDFWHALDESSGQDVTTIMNAWIKEPGHPIVSIEVREANGGLDLELSQARYYSDRDVPPSSQRWPVPLVLKYGTRGTVREKRLLLSDERAHVRIDGAEWVYANAGGRGFYRWQLDDKGDRLLDGGVKQLAPEERLSLVDNMWALTRTGRASLASFLRRLDTLAGEEDRTVIGAISDALAWLSTYAVRDRTERPFTRFVDEFYRPIFEKIGWRPRDGEDTDTREKRSRVLGMLGFHAAAADVRQGARDRVLRHLDGTEPLHPDGAGTIIAIAATEGDDALWDRYVRRMQSAQATDAQEEARFRQSLVSFEDPQVARRTADAIFSSTIRTQDRGLMVIPFLGTRRTRDVGWVAVREHWDADIATAEPLLKQRFVQAVGQLAQQRYRDEAIAFLEAKRKPDIEETVKQSVERLRVNTAAAERLAKELEEALATPATR